MAQSTCQRVIRLGWQETTGGETYHHKAQVKAEGWAARGLCWQDDILTLKVGWGGYEGNVLLHTTCVVCCTYVLWHKQLTFAFVLMVYVFNVIYLQIVFTHNAQCNYAWAITHIFKS